MSDGGLGGPFVRDDGLGVPRYITDEFRRVVGQTLTEFLLARITEDEARAPDAIKYLIDDYYQVFTPERIVGECTAKRQIVELHGELLTMRGEPYGYCRMCAENEEADWDGAPPVAWPCPTLRHLASVYADHPDYREDWRP